MKKVFRRLIDINGSDLINFEKQQIRGGTDPEPISEEGNYNCWCKYVDENENMSNLGTVNFYHTGGSIAGPALQACISASYSATNQVACSLVGEG